METRYKKMAKVSDLEGLPIDSPGRSAIDAFANPQHFRVRFITPVLIRSVVFVVAEVRGVVTAQRVNEFDVVLPKARVHRFLLLLTYHFGSNVVLVPVRTELRIRTLGPMGQR